MSAINPTGHFGGEVIYFLSAEELTDTELFRYFRVNSRTGEVFLVSGLDRDPPAGRPQWKFTVYARLEGDLEPFGFSDVILNLKDINDNAPKFSRDVYLADIRENSPVGTKISGLSVQAVDYDEGSKITFGLEWTDAELDGSMFVIDQDSGVITLARYSIDVLISPSLGSTS